MADLRIFELAIDDIAIDPRGCSELVNRTLVRGSSRRRVSGMCADDRYVYLSLERKPPEAGPQICRFAELSSLNPDEIAGGIMARYNAGFTTIGSFMAGGRLWALFARDNAGKGAAR
ncbi:MAG: hypothetical protein AB7F40_08325 [Victivallaceae bacterium]|nr:hypothetical protein [Victivallaceae bacterium]